jgi:hypothetical protein
MAKAAKAKPKTKAVEESQGERFKRTARSLACEESPGALDRAFGKIAAKRGHAPSTKRD